MSPVQPAKRLRSLLSHFNLDWTNLAGQEYSACQCTPRTSLGLLDGPEGEVPEHFCVVPERTFKLLREEVRKHEPMLIENVLRPCSLRPSTCIILHSSQHSFAPFLQAQPLSIGLMASILTASLHPERIGTDERINTSCCTAASSSSLPSLNVSTLVASCAACEVY
jgi:hypothetical protein